ncbi:MAG: TonB-dependent receptor [Colwellia sp.]|nr:TonB-dependent receptor [Colwellia sp.]
MKFTRIASAVSASLLLSATHHVIAAEVTLDEEQHVERIIVTGQKIARTLQETTTSVAVVTAAQIEQQNISSFYDALTITANTHATSDGSFSIRGINGTNVSGGGNSYLASVYVDGASLPRQMISGGSFSTWDANQVEILRGPQSTLQGRNALAGAVIMNTQAATHDWEGKYRLQTGEYGEREAAIAFGGGLVEDQLAFRFSGEHKEADGFIENLTLKAPGNAREDQLYRLKFLLTPDALSDFTAQLSYTHAENERGLSWINNPNYGNSGEKISVYNHPYIYNNLANKKFYDADIISLKLDYSLNDEWDLTSVTTNSSVDDGSIRDADGTAEELSRNNWNTSIDTFSQELLLTFDYENLQGIVGVYYFNEDIASKTIGLSNLSLDRAGLDNEFLMRNYGLDAGTAGLVLSQYDAFNPAVYVNTGDTTTEVTSYALFTDLVYQITDQWDIYAGLRLDREEQKNADHTTVALNNGHLLPDPASYQGTPYEGLIPLITGINAFIHNSVENANGTTPLVDASFDTVLPKIGVSYHWNEDLTTSFTFQQGYRSGGVGTNTATATAYQYDPEYTDNYEFSVRSTWLDGALIANANLFYIDWTDQQVRVQLSGNVFDSETKNAGSSKLQGFELELNYQVNNQLKLYSSIGQAKSEFTDFLVATPKSNTESSGISAASADDFYDLSGRSFADSPQWTGNIGATYTADNGFFANVSANYASTSTGYINPFISGHEPGDEYYDVQNPSRTLVNMQLGYEWEMIGVYLKTSNLLDEEYLEFNGDKTITIGQPRQVSLSIRGSF